MTSKKSEQLNTLMEMAVLVNSTLDPQQVHKRAIAAVMNLLDADAGSLILLDEEKSELFFDVALGKKGDVLEHVRLKKGEGIAGWVAEHGLPQIIKDVKTDPRFSNRFDEISGFVTRDLVCVPVRIKDKIIGVLEAINKRKGQFENSDTDILVALANHVAIALDNAFLHKENLTRLTEMVATEKRHLRDREKLVKDLHDGVGGIMANISILAELAQKSDSLDDLKKSLATIAELSREGTSEIRSFMNSLENSEATWNDLASEFRRYGNCLCEPHKISFSLNAGIDIPEKQPGIYLYMMIFRILRESLTNVIKHSRAKNVDVLFAVGNEGLVLTVRDDGIGLGDRKINGRGIANMKSRAGEIGGDLNIDFSPGACVTLKMPPFPC